MKHSFEHISILALVVLTVVAAPARSENMSVSAVTVAAASSRSEHALVTFNISWRNSWRTASEPGNHDAAWVFVKFRERGGIWRHATLSTDAAHHAVRRDNRVAARVEVGVTDGRGVGVFLSRAREGRGTIAWRNVALRWLRADDGVSTDADVEVRVFALEMVHVPRGEFAIGDGSRTLVQGQLHRSGFVTQPFLIDARAAVSPVALGGFSADALANNDGVGMFETGEDDFSSLVTQTLPPTFPKGYDGFHIMKYEITEREYVDFLNTLTPAQQAQRAYTSGENGNEIRLRGGVYVTAVPDQSCSNLNWADGAAFCDWAGLRPMTELEFEKAGRGPGLPMPNAFAWGDTTLPASMGGFGNPFATAEVETDDIEEKRRGGGPRHDDPGERVAVRAAGAPQGPRALGASYWGVMDLSGRLWERCVSIGHPLGRAFDGKPGDGMLDAQGSADVEGWPGADAVGSGFRGGAIFDKIAARRVSDRYYANYPSDYRYGNSGFRGVR
jgi:formylglycine-generating enzyme required for sulfatase activity